MPKEIRTPKPKGPKPDPAKKKPRRPKQYQNYSDEEKAHAIMALKANGGNVNKTAKELGIPKQTLEQWDMGWHLHPSVKDLVSLKTRPLSDTIEDLAYSLVHMMQDPTKMYLTPLKDLASCLNTAVEKMRLLRDQPTNIHGSAEPTDDELIGRLRGIASRFRQRNASADTPGEDRGQLGCTEAATEQRQEEAREESV